MNTTRVSIIMPFLDRSRFLKPAIESLQAQTRGDWELIAVDGGSRDGARELMENYAAADPRIRIFENPAGGIAANRNLALARAGAEYVAVLDSDDVALPRRLERQVAFLDSRPDLCGTGSGVEFIDADGKPLALEKYKQRLTDPHALRRRQREGWSCFVHSSMLIRRSAMLAVGGYREIFRLAEDDDLFLRLLHRHDLANLPETLVQYRWHGGNTTGSLDSLVHRAAALASAHLRMAELPDALEERKEPIDYPFLREALDGMRDAALPVWLMWIGVLQHYRLGEPGMLEEAWERVAALSPPDTMKTEIDRHRRCYRDNFPESRDAAIRREGF